MKVLRSKKEAFQIKKFGNGSSSLEGEFFEINIYTSIFFPEAVPTGAKRITVGLKTRENDWIELGALDPEEANSWRSGRISEKIAKEFGTELRALEHRLRQIIQRESV